jgi:hypothetical protein
MGCSTKTTQTSAPALDKKTNESPNDTKDIAPHIPPTSSPRSVEDSDEDWCHISPSDIAKQSMPTYPAGFIRNTHPIHDDDHKLCSKNLALLSIIGKKDSTTDRLLQHKESPSEGSAGTRRPSISGRSSKSNGGLDKPWMPLSSASTRENDLKSVGSWPSNKDISGDHHSKSELSI